MLHCQVLALLFSQSVVVPPVVFVVVLPQAVLLFFVALAFEGWWIVLQAIIC
jgi:hypothetical protein